MAAVVAAAVDAADWYCRVAAVTAGDDVAGVVYEATFHKGEYTEYKAWLANRAYSLAARSAALFRRILLIELTLGNVA